MSLLEMLWRSIFVLAGTSILTLLLLVIRRTADEQRIKRTARDWEQIKEQLFTYMDAEDDAQIPHFPRAERATERNLAIHLADMIKGHEKDRLCAFLESTGHRKRALRRLRNLDYVKRREAVTALRLFGDEVVRRKLRDRLLNDPSGSVRLAAARSLLAHDDLPAPRVLARLLRDHALRSLDARSIFRDLARSQPMELARLLTDRHSSIALQLVCADALGESPDYRVIPYLNVASQSSNAELRAVSMESLGKLEHISAEHAIERGLKDTDWFVRIHALVAAGRIGLHYQTDQILPLLDDSNWWVRYRAAEALFKVGRRGQTALIEKAQDTDRSGLMAALILDEFGMAH